MSATMTAPAELASLQWDDLRLLLACQRSGSLTAAAAQLGCHPATASRRVTHLEDSLGVVLFRRGKTGLALTPACAALMPAVEAAEAAIQQILRSAKGAESEVRGVVRLSMPPGVADALVVPLLGRLRDRHPQLQVEIEASTRYFDLERGEADLVVRVRRPEAGALVVQQLLETRLAVMGSRAQFSASEPQRLRDLQWLTWDHDLAHLPHTRWLSSHIDDRQIALRCNAQSALMAAAVRGLGVVLCPVVEGAQHGLALVPLTPADQHAVAALPPASLWLACHSAMRQVPRIAAVWAFLREEVAAMRAEGMEL